MSKTYFITGTNRGLGLELLRQTTADPTNTVIGTVRDKDTLSTDLSALLSSVSNLKLVTLDVSSLESIEAVDAQLQELSIDGIDVFINNAAIVNSTAPVMDAEWDDFMIHFETNTVGPIKLMKVIKPYLAKRDTKKAMFVSSMLGSVQGFIPHPTAIYSVTKAGLNSAVKGFDFLMKREGYTIVAGEPGIVQTDMMDQFLKAMSFAGPAAIENIKARANAPQVPAAGFLALLGKITPEDGGKLFSHTGEERSF